MSNYYNGTSAYKIDNFDYNPSGSVQDNIAKRQQVRVNKKAAFVKNVRLFVVFAAVFATALGLLFTNAMIIEKSSAVNDMQTQLKEITEANAQMKVDIEKNLDLKKIEDIAINELGMKRPDKYQVVYVNVKQNNYAEVAKTDEKQSGIKQIMAYIN